MDSTVDFLRLSETCCLLLVDLEDLQEHPGPTEDASLQARRVFQIQRLSFDLPVAELSRLAKNPGQLEICLKKHHLDRPHLIGLDLSQALLNWKIDVHSTVSDTGEAVRYGLTPVGSSAGSSATSSSSALSAGSSSSAMSSSLPMKKLRPRRGGTRLSDPSESYLYQSLTGWIESLSTAITLAQKTSFRKSLSLGIYSSLKEFKRHCVVERSRLVWARSNVTRIAHADLALEINLAKRRFDEWILGIFDKDRWRQRNVDLDWHSISSAVRGQSRATLQELWNAKIARRRFRDSAVAVLNGFTTVAHGCPKANECSKDLSPVNFGNAPKSVQNLLGSLGLVPFDLSRDFDSLGRRARDLSMSQKQKDYLLNMLKDTREKLRHDRVGFASMSDFRWGPPMHALPAQTDAEASKCQRVWTWLGTVSLSEAESHEIPPPTPRENSNERSYLTELERFLERRMDSSMYTKKASLSAFRSNLEHSEVCSLASSGDLCSMKILNGAGKRRRTELVDLTKFQQWFDNEKRTAKVLPPRSRDTKRPHRRIKTERPCLPRTILALDPAIAQGRNL